MLQATTCLPLVIGLTGPLQGTGQSAYPQVDCGLPTPWSPVLIDHGHPPHLWETSVT